MDTLPTPVPTFTLIVQYCANLPVTFTVSAEPPSVPTIGLQKAPLQPPPLQPSKP